MNQITEVLLRQFSHTQFFTRAQLLLEVVDLPVYVHPRPRVEAQCAGDVLCVRFQRGLFYTFDRDRKLDLAVKDFGAVEELGDAKLAARGRKYIDSIGRLKPEQGAREPALVPTVAQVAVVGAHLPGEGQHQGPGEIRRGLGEHVGRVGDHDLAIAGRRQVAVIDADRAVDESY